MATVMKASEFAKILIDIATNYKTLYVMGCYGAPMTPVNKKYYCNNHAYNNQPSRTKMIQSVDANTFGFDCSNLIKGVLWGWVGDNGKSHGGARYKSNGVPDVNADNMISMCIDVTTNFSNIQVGEAVWCKGHIGVYVGDGLVIESTPAWKNKVQITALANIGSKPGYNARKWVKHGKLPWIEYDVTDTPKKVSEDMRTVTAQLPQISKGSMGKAVKLWQTILGIEADGAFGPATHTATLAFQKKVFPNKKSEWDGYVGEKTWKAGLESIK